MVLRCGEIGAAFLYSVSVANHAGIAQLPITLLPADMNAKYERSGGVGAV